MKYLFEYEKQGQKPNINKFVLLSGSPRRKELLSFLKPKIKLVNLDERLIEEKYMEFYKDEDFVTRVAKTCCEISKAKSDIELLDDTMYISADTMVIFNNEIYNKPIDKLEANKMFRSYFGSSHYVVTSVCLRAKNYIDVFYNIAKITFIDYYPELENLINNYVNSDSPMDKAGAYGIQDLDPRFVKCIEGDVYTIIGLPVSVVSERIFGEALNVKFK